MNAKAIIGSALASVLGLAFYEIAIAPRIRAARTDDPGNQA